jgi:hypothetical protein
VLDLLQEGGVSVLYGVARPAQIRFHHVLVGLEVAWSSLLFRT